MAIYSIKVNKLGKYDSYCELFHGKKKLANSKPLIIRFKHERAIGLAEVGLEMFYNNTDIDITEDERFNLVNYCFNVDGFSEWMIENADYIMNQVINTVFNKAENEYDFSKFINEKKKTNNSLFLDYEDTKELIKLCLINKLMFMRIISTPEDQYSEMFEHMMLFYKAVGIKESTIDKLYRITRSQIRKMALTNKYLWNLYQYEHGQENLAFILNIFTQTVTKFAMFYNIQDRTSPISYFISNINNQVMWWINQHFGNIRMLGMDNEGFDGIFSNASKNDRYEKTLSTYDKVLYEKFINEIKEFIVKFKIKDDDLNLLTEVSKTHKISIVSKYVLSYIIAKTFEYDFESILTMALLNKYIAIRFLVIVKTLVDYLKKELNETMIVELSRVFAACNIFIPNHSKSDDSILPKDMIMLDHNFDNIVAEYLNNGNFKYNERSLFALIFEKIDKALTIKGNYKLPFFAPTAVVKGNVKKVKRLSKDTYIKYVFIKIFSRIVHDNEIDGLALDSGENCLSLLINNFIIYKNKHIKHKKAS